MGRDLATNKGDRSPEAISGRAVLDALTDGVITYSANGQCESANEAAVRLFGIPREHLLRQNLRELPFWKAYGLLDLAEETMSSGHPRQCETPYPTDSDKSRWLNFRLAQVEVDGEPTLLAVIADVSKRRQAEKALRLAEFSVNRVADMMSWISPEGRFLFVNDSLCRHLGYTREELLSMTVWEVDPNILESWDERWFESKRRGSRTFESTHRTKSGEVCLVEVTTNYIEHEGQEYLVAFSRDVTERTRAEELLTDEISLRRLLVEQSTDGIVVLDQWGKVYEANQQFARMLGYSLEEVRELHVWDWDTQFSKEQLLEMLGVDDDKGSHIETRHRRKDGTPCEVEISTNGAVYSGRKFIFCVCRDITERRLAEEALLQAKEYAENLIQTADAMVVGLDVDGNVTVFNTGAERISGYTLADIKGKNWFEMLVPKGRYPRVWEQFARLAKCGGFPRTFENPILTKSGEERTISWQNSQLSENGNIVGTISFGTDITERKRAEEALRESEERFRGVFEQGSVGIAVLDPNLRFVRANSAFCEMLGYQEDELLGKSIAEVTAGEDVQSSLEDTGALYSGKLSVLSMEKRYLRRNGELVWGHVSASLLRDKGGNPVGTVAMVQDITESRRAEKTLLERDEQLRQAQKMEAVGQLAGGIAHDFNNLLTAILGYSELLLTRKELADSSAREDIEEIKAAADRASALTRQILAFSRRQPLRPTVASLNEVLNGMESLLRRTLGENIDLVTLAPHDLGQVAVDVHQFEQVLLNLAVNARDAMASGGRLTLETGNVELDEQYCHTHPETTPGRYVMLAVSDTGVGMDEATLEHIFEPFFTTKAPGEGTGLGLSTVYGIVKQSSGSVSVYSEPGKGTSFKIYLPRVTEQVEREIPVVAGSASAGRNETILLVEDEISLRRLVARILEGLGYRVRAAGTASEALLAAKDADYRFDLLLTDLVLPGGAQGNDLARELLASRPDLPVLYVSGYTRDAIVHAGRLDQGVNFLAKPFTPEALARMVRSVLDRARASE